MTISQSDHNSSSTTIVRCGANDTAQGRTYGLQAVVLPIEFSTIASSDGGRRLFYTLIGFKDFSCRNRLFCPLLNVAQDHVHVRWNRLSFALAENVNRPSMAQPRRP